MEAIQVRYRSFNWLGSIGKLKMIGKQSQVDKDALILKMIDDEEVVDFRQPKHLLYYLYAIWIFMGLYEVKRHYIEYNIFFNNYSNVTLYCTKLNF